MLNLTNCRSLCRQQNRPRQPYILYADVLAMAFATLPKPTSPSTARNTTASSMTSWRSVITKDSDPAHKQTLERLRGFDWLSYIAASVWHAGFRDRRERDEKTHEVVVKLLTGKLFKGYDPRLHGPMDLRFKRSVGKCHPEYRREGTEQETAPAYCFHRSRVPARLRDCRRPACPITNR